MAKNGNSRWIKWLVILVILAGIAGLVIWHFAGKGDTGPDYQTDEVDYGDITEAVTATGALNPVTNVTVGSQISGNIQKLYVDWNSKVKADQVVAQLDPSTYQAAVAQAEGDLASATATEELDQVEAKRADELFKSKLISQSDHDTAIATLHQAQAMVQIKQAALNNAKVNLARCTIYSPVDGVVISRNVDVGQTVAASLSAPTLFMIANDLTKMQIDANVAEADVGGVEDGQNVRFHVDAFPDRTFLGKVVQIRDAPTNYQNVVAYDTVISVDNEDKKLKPGMTATVDIVVAERTNALRVPNSALRFHPPEVFSNDVKTNAPSEMKTNVASMTSTNHGGGRGGHHGHANGPGGPMGEHQPVRTVYLVEDPAQPTKLTPAQVKVGISDGVYTEVLSGLKEGDVVVTGLKYPDESSGPQSNPFGRHFGRR